MTATISQRPGVTILETLTAANTTSTQSASVEAFMGPINQGPLTPTLITSWQQFNRTYGGFVAGSTNYLAHAVYQFFANGGSQAYVLRVVGTGSASATRAFSDTDGTPAVALNLTAKNAGAWGNNLYAEWTAGSSSTLTTLRLFIIPTGQSVSNNQVVETWTDLSLDPANTRNALAVLNDPISGSNYVTATTGGSYTFATGDVLALSSQVGGDPLTTGADGAAPAVGATGPYFTAVSSFNSVLQPFVLNIPALTDSATINAIIPYADASLGGRGDVFLVIDCGPNLSATSEISAAAAYTPTSYAATYFPRIIVPDPSTSRQGATIALAPGGAVLGQYAATDAQRGVFKTPAGLSNKISNALALETNLNNSDLDNLNAAGVNAIRNQPGAGIVIMGGRTLHLSPSDKYISIRRTLIFVEDQLKRVTAFAIFEPNDAVLWSHLTSVCANVLIQLWQAGGLSGASQDQAFFVVCDGTVNTVQSIAAGQVNIQIGVALEYPAEYVVINIGQSSGGTTVTENA